jgi:hypothetical protein
MSVAARRAEVIVWNRSLGFVQKRMRSNPIIMHMLRQPSRLTFVWWLIGGVSLLTLIGSLFDKDNSVMNVLTFIGGLTLLVNIMWGIQTAAAQTCQTTQSDAYQLLFLTTLSDMKLIEAYIFATLYRLRVALILTLGVIPSVIVHLTDLTFRDSTTAAFHWLLFFSISIVAAFGVFLFGIVSATELALRWGNRHAASFGVILLVLALISIYFSFFPASQLDNDPIFSIIPSILYTIILYALVLAILLESQRVARRRP